MLVRWRELDDTLYPHLKKCGPIEAVASPDAASLPASYPHLKKCGPIEADVQMSGSFPCFIISALEKVRPH